MGGPQNLGGGPQSRPPPQTIPQCPPKTSLPPPPLQARGMDLVEILSFLFQLSFSTLGKVGAGRGGTGAYWE